MATEDIGRAGWRINDWAQQVGLCRASVYNLLNAGAIEAVKVGKQVTVITTDPRAFLASQAKVKLHQKLPPHRASLATAVWTAPPRDDDPGPLAA
jgi:hypothetical protein